MRINARRFSPKWWVMLPWVAADIYRRLTPPDPSLHAMSYWSYGSLPRKSIEQIARDAARAELTILNPGTRDPGTSVNLFELSCILMLMKSANARKVIEIGTFDGNTTLNMAMNLPPEGRVVSVDLPVDEPVELALPVESDVERNVTDRMRVGEQFRDHAVARSKIVQVFANSAKLDFSTLDGPFDFAFIDGCHAYNYVKSDTAHIMCVMRPGGIVVWHDYAMMEAVSRAVDEFRGEFAALEAVASTRLAVGIMRL